MGCILTQGQDFVQGGRATGQSDSDPKLWYNHGVNNRTENEPFDSNIGKTTWEDADESYTFMGCSSCIVVVNRMR